MASWSPRCTVTDHHDTSHAPVLVIGVGSPLRTDDAVGRVVADRLGELDLPGVETQAVHQLAPELAAGWFGRRLVILVDADVEVTAPLLRTVARPTGSGAMSHHVDPASLLGLASLLGNPPDTLEVLSLPVADLTLGTELSEAAETVAERAVALLRERCAAVVGDPGGAPA